MVSLVTADAELLTARALPRAWAPGRQSYQPKTVGPAFVGVIRIRQRPCLIMAAR